MPLINCWPVVTNSSVDFICSPLLKFFKKKKKKKWVFFGCLFLHEKQRHQENIIDCVSYWFILSRPSELLPTCLICLIVIWKGFNLSKMHQIVKDYDGQAFCLVHFSILQKNNLISVMRDKFCSLLLCFPFTFSFRKTHNNLSSWIKYSSCLTLGHPPAPPP